jgi:hypothetical protein
MSAGLWIGGNTDFLAHAWHLTALGAPAGNGP